jgi:hypothetical protein
MELAGRKIFGSTAGFNRVLLVRPAVGFSPRRTVSAYNNSYFISANLADVSPNFRENQPLYTDIKMEGDGCYLRDLYNQYLKLTKARP